MPTVPSAGKENMNKILTFCLTAGYFLTPCFASYLKTCIDDNKLETIKIIRPSGDCLWILSYNKNGGATGANSYFSFKEGDTVLIKTDIFSQFFGGNSPICEDGRHWVKIK